MLRHVLPALLALLPLLGVATAAGPSPPLLLAHLMPWYEAPPTAGWGWHWTMNHYRPDSVAAGRRPIASRFYPVIGPYHSGDEHVIEYQLLLMRLAGIDGVILDWYGHVEHLDYGVIHRNSERIVAAANRLGMKVAVCYEDRTLATLEAAGKLAGDREAHVAAEIEWLAKAWFPLECYVRLDGKPLLLSFGHEGLDDAGWQRARARAGTPVAYVGQQHLRPGAAGGFDWPVPKRGLEAIETFATQSQSWPMRIPVAFPRFADIYAQAGVHESWGSIADDDGKTFKTSLAKAFAMQPPVIQLATWNDWGEGTVLEPSTEFGTRDLELLQAVRRRYVDPAFTPRAADLGLPQRLLELRRRPDAATFALRLDDAAALLARGDAAGGRAILDAIPPPP